MHYNHYKRIIENSRKSYKMLTMLIWAARPTSLDPTCPLFVSMGPHNTFNQENNEWEMIKESSRAEQPHYIPTHCPPLLLTPTLMR